MIDNIFELHTPSSDQSWTEIEEAGVTKMITVANLAQSLHALHKTGIAQKLYQAGSEGIHKSELTSAFDSYLLSHFLNYLKVHGIIEETSGGYRLREDKRSLASPVAGAQFGFYLEAYGPIVSSIPEFIAKAKVYGTDVERDGRALGIHCATLFNEYHTETVLKALAETQSEKILDIGCGAGQFLIDACTQNPNLRGVGLDISAPAIQEANRVARASGLEDRLKFVVADAFKPGSWPIECKDVDTICAVGVLHEHFRGGEKDVVAILNTYADLFKNGVKSFILGEPEIRYDLDKNDVDLYLIHIFTAQGFPRHREEWLEFFPKSNLQCKATYTRPNAGPRFNFFVLEERI